MNSFRVNRDLAPGKHRLHDIFTGLEEVDSLKRCIGSPTLRKRIIEDTYVTLTLGTRYMHVNDEDGSLVIGLDYLRTADTRYLYLDMIHELVHIKQYLDGKELFDESYSYVERPTELEAYQCAVEEARKINMTDDTIADYLYVEWITRKEHARLMKSLGVQIPTRHKES